MKFQSTRPRGARRVFAGRVSRSVFRFNPRARGGRDPAYGLGSRSGDAVSIHAPAGGATHRDPMGADGAHPVSIHAPAGGATALIDVKPVHFALSFNPRARGGRDISLFPLISARSVSIHAPAGGATRAGIGHRPARRRFNPRARGGRDLAAHRIAAVPVLVSIHAPAGGATQAKSGHLARSSGVSIHAPAGGATPCLHNCLKTLRKIPQICEPRDFVATSEADTANHCAASRQSKDLLSSRTPRDSSRCLWFALNNAQRISGPFKSSTGLAPTCSTLSFQLLPR